MRFQDKSSAGLPGFDAPLSESREGSRAEQRLGFIQQHCASAVRGMAEDVEHHLLQLGQAGMDIEGAKLIEQALLIGIVEACRIILLSAMCR